METLYLVLSNKRKLIGKLDTKPLSIAPSIVTMFVQKLTVVYVVYESITGVSWQPS
jgi:hypothetical protein